MGSCHSWPQVKPWGFGAKTWQLGVIKVDHCKWTIPMPRGVSVQFLNPGFLLVRRFRSRALLRLFVASALFETAIKGPRTQGDDMLGFTRLSIGQIDLPARWLAWGFKMLGNKSIQQKTRVLGRFRQPIPAARSTWEQSHIPAPITGLGLLKGPHPTPDGPFRDRGRS